MADGNRAHGLHQRRSHDRPNKSQHEEQFKRIASKKHLFIVTNTIDPRIELEILRIQTKRIKTAADIVLLCMLRFRQIRALMRRVPKNPDAWLNFQLALVKRKLGPMKYLSDKDIKKIIITVKQINANRHVKSATDIDPDLPSCYYWGVAEVGQWLIMSGYPHLKEMFAKNCISGRKLITVDASALSKMGLKYFEEIQLLASKIRGILKIHRPNMMRALIRLVPFEEYLKQREYTGQSYNDTTFLKFCQAHDYPYQRLKENPLALIECTCELGIYLSAFVEVENEEQEDNLSDHNSLILAPTVEFTVRHILVRDKVVSELIDQLIEIGFETQSKGEIEAARLRKIFENGFDELGLSHDELAKRLEFGRWVAEEVLREAKRTQEVLQDLNQFRKFLKDQNISEDTLNQMRDVATEFFNSAATVGSLLAVGELDLDVIFRQEPEFNDFVDGIINEAELKLDEGLPAEAFVQNILSEAKLRIMTTKFPHLEPEEVRSAQNFANSVLDEMTTLGVLSVDEAKRNSEDELLRNRTISQEAKRADRGGMQNETHRKVPQSHLGSKNPSTTVGFFTVHYNNKMDDFLSKKFAGEKTEENNGSKIQNPIVSLKGAGDCAHSEEPKTKGIIGEFEQFQNFSEFTTNMLDSELNISSESTNIMTDSELDSSEHEEEEMIWEADGDVNFMLNHVVNDVIQEALTQLLELPDSEEAARRIMLSLEELKNKKCNIND